MSISSSPLDVTLGAEQTAGESVVRAVDLPAGQLIGRYLVVERLGAGAMGVVYAAYDPELARRIAIKVLRESAAPGTPRRARLLREAQALARLAHPNVVAIHDVGTLDERVWIAMEYVEGETLGAWRKRTQPTWREVLAVMSAAARGLAAAHAVGLVHRDVKPDNVMVDREGRVRVMDFGLAFAIHSGDASDSSFDASRPSMGSQAQTLAGALLGTPGYMSPEQLHHRDVDASSDQFAFCVTLWEACYGIKAFPGDNVVEISAAVLQGRVADPPSTVRVPRWLRDVALRGMAVERSHRFASMNELLDALERGQSRARRRIAGVAAAGIAVVGGIAYASHLTVERARASACADEGNAIAEVWPGAGGSARAAMTRAITGTGLAFAADTIERVSLRADGHAAAWASARTAACLRDDADELRPQILTCLDSRRDALATTIEIFGEADAGVAKAAVSAIAGLAPVAECEDPKRLALVNDDAGSRDESRELRRRVTMLNAEVRAGRVGGLLARADALVADARALGNESILVHAYALRADALMRESKYEAAAAVMRTQFTTALAAGQDEEGVEAAAMLAFAIGYRLARLDEGQQWIEIADALLRRVPDDDGSTESLVRHNQGILFARARDWERAVENLERARALVVAAKGAGDLAVARVNSDLGAFHSAAGDHVRALAEHESARATFEAMLGPEHPMLVTTYINIAWPHLMLGHNAEAIASLERAVAISEKSEGLQNANVAMALESLGSIHYQVGEIEEALAELERSVAIRVAVLPKEHPDLVSSRVELATAELRLGRIDAARGHLNEALTSPAARDRPPVAGWIAMLLGRAHLERGEHSEAIAVLEPVIAAGAVGSPNIAYGKLTLAEAIRRSGGDMTRARTLVREARDLLALPGLKHELWIADLDAWLAAHG